MPIFEGNKDKGIQRLFIEMPEAAKNQVVWKYTDDQILQHSTVNVDLDYVAVFTNLGKVIGTLPAGRHKLGEGASLTLGWLVDRLTGNAYYDAELYYVATRDIADINFGGPIDNVLDKPSGLIVSLRIFGNLAYKVVDPIALIAKLVGTDGDYNHDAQIVEWIKDQCLASLRAILPPMVVDHGVLLLGNIQDQAIAATLAKANSQLSLFGLAVETFAQFNINASDEDLAKIKQLSEAKAFTEVAGSYTDYAKGQAMIDIAKGVEQGNVGAQPGMMVGMMMGTNPGGMPQSQPAPQYPAAPPVTPVAPQAPV
ncbi:MAG: SPFH domain-containing protein, partial [Acidimicrobiales bacterium]|nr:SPFH domain-containing protein [Acidimicrobiales bacterium]